MPGTVNPADLGGPYYIYRWVASSATWLPITPVRGRWTSLANSADGSVLAAASYFGTAISTNFGATWVTNAGPRSWVIACSTDGTRMVAAQGGNGGTNIYTSLDSGQTWTSNNAPALQWTGVCISADGSFMAASTLDDKSGEGSVYIAHIPAQPSLAIAQCGTNLSLSWPLPSTGFVLQQSADITSTNWASVTNGATPTNYWNQVTLSPPAAGNAFYRLVNP
jgi:hypothetical protein